jgi:ATP-dependent Lhr-like helicase
MAKPRPSRRDGKGAQTALREFHPVVRRWFTETLGTPSAPQLGGWPAIASGGNALILAPTGTGKTLAAFLWELNALITAGLERPLANAIHLLYISPLKALNNDIQRNLERPLAELRERFVASGREFPEIRVAVRTGDTPASARARMMRTTPHVLITTPESLHILLTSLRGRGMFSAVRAVIVDEIHAVAGTKRGAHLALTLERLEHLVGRPLQRIGLSATQRPLEEISRFLVGARDCRIVDCGLVKQTETTIVSPVPDLSDVSGSVWTSVAPLVLERIRSARTTLVFVNNRGQAERMAARINALAGEQVALPYHGSLSRERRLLLEQRLKAGDLRALVSTSSLELGIDIGSVDLVIQLQSPKRVANGLQRVGRAGHTLGAVSRGVFVPTFLDDAMELTAIVQAMRDGDVEPTRVVHNALDVLAQVIVAAVSVDEWTAADLFDVIKKAYPYHTLTRPAFDEVLAMLSGKYPSDLAAELAQRVTWDRTTDRLTGSRASRMTAVISGGTIPDRGLYTVNLPDRTRLGELDEEFVHESRVGDVFQLGSSTWRISAIEHDRVIVTPAPGAPARMPFWHGEYMARSFHLTHRVGELRRTVASVDPEDDAALDVIAARYAADRATIHSLVHYVREQRAVCGSVPDDRELVLEHFRDEVGAVRLVLHAPFGGRVNAPWGMALAQRAREALATDGNRPEPAGRGRPPGPGSPDVQVQTTDDGIMLRLPNLGGRIPIDAILGLEPAEAERRILDEVGSTSLFGARFRMNAARALLLPRGNPQRRMPLWLQRLKSLDLLQTVQSYPSFPILVETYRDVLQDAFDMTALATVLTDLQRGAIRVRVVEVERPSPFAASLQFGFVMDWLYVDDTPRAEQRAAYLSLDRALLDEVMGSEGADPETTEAIDDVLAIRRGTAPNRRARSADELAVLIDRAGDLTLDEARDRVADAARWTRGDPLDALLAAERVIQIDVPAAGEPAPRLILTETFARYAAAFGLDAGTVVRTGQDLAPRAAADVVPASLRDPSLSPGAARREILARWLTVSGPVSVEEIRARYDLPEAWLAKRLDEWQRDGKLVRGFFGQDRTVARWCSRRVLEHARRRALAKARQQITAVGLPDLVAFLQRWQHLDPRDRVTGNEGVSAIVRQLAGLVRPAAAWERDYLPARVRPYDAAALTGLTQSGSVVWIGDGGSAERSDARALTGLRFVERGTASLWLAADESPSPSESVARPPVSETAEKVLEALRAYGASFIVDLQIATGLTMLALRDALRELAAAGLVTNDSAEALREVIRFRPLLPGNRRDDPDPTRWLPADFAPSPGRPIVQRRPNLRRLPKWRRPDLPGGRDGWVGRWSLVRTPGILGPARDDETRAEAVARQWLDRYGIVTRDWWRRERPAVSWREIYRELRRLELRGEVRRGYFVRGLAGAQFATASAVDALRAVADDTSAPAITMSVSDPANAYALPLPVSDEDRPALAHPRARGALLVTRRGRVIISAEGRGRRLGIAPDATDEDVRLAAESLVSHLLLPAPGVQRRHDLEIETIDGAAATKSPHAAAFVAAGFRRDGLMLRKAVDFA